MSEIKTTYTERIMQYEQIKEDKQRRYILTKKDWRAGKRLWDRVVRYIRPRLYRFLSYSFDVFKKAIRKSFSNLKTMGVVYENRKHR